MKEHSILPGFGLTVGMTLLYLSLLVLLPLSALLVKGFEEGVGGLLVAVADPRTRAALRVTFGSALVAALLNAILGTLVAWFLVRIPFPGKRVIDALVDLPFAMPTAVSGIALATLFAPEGRLGALLLCLGVNTTLGSGGIVLAMLFVTLPFVIRSVQPALVELGGELEQAATSLGATAWQTFWYVTLPLLAPAIISGFTLAFARALGEYGAIIFIAGNIPFKSEVASLLIITKLEQFDYSGATALALLLLGLSFAALLLVNLLSGGRVHVGLNYLRHVVRGVEWGSERGASGA